MIPNIKKKKKKVMKLYNFQYTIRNFKNKIFKKKKIEQNRQGIPLQQGTCLGKQGDITMQWLHLWSSVL